MTIEVIRGITARICSVGFLICFILSLIPFPLSNGWKTGSLYLPVVGTLLYAVYESLIPAEWNIRTDLLFFLPVLFFLWINGIAKVWIMMVARRQSYKNSLVMRQLIFTLLAILGSVLIYFLVIL
jgi:hypothetical protein